MGGGRLIFSIIAWLFCMFALFFVLHGCASQIWDNQVDTATNLTIYQGSQILETNSAVTNYVFYNQTNVYLYIVGGTIIDYQTNVEFMTNEIITSVVFIKTN